MRITLDVPDDIAEGLAASGHDVPRAALEALAVEGYRTGTLTQAHVRRLLGYQTRAEVDGFLKRHGVWLEYTLDDLERDHEALRRLQP
jgi:predicted HTH domain antitoxin